MVLPLALGMLFMGVLLIAVIFWQSGGWVDEISDTMNARKVEYFTTRTNFGASVAKSTLSTFQLDVQNLASYAKLALKTGPEFTITRPYLSFFKSRLDDGDPPKPNPETLYSDYFIVNITTSSQLTTFTPALTTTILDNILRPLKLDRDLVELVYFGFEDLGFREYPYKYDTSEFRTELVCDKFDPSQPALFNRVGYIPGCRDWYRDARNASIGQGKVIDSLGPVVLSTPYISATTQRVTITASQAVYADSRLIGVAAVDVQMSEFLEDFSRHSNISNTNGFTFIMSKKGNLVTYDSRRLNGTKLYGKNVINISSIEFQNDPKRTNDFLDSVQNAASSGNSTDFLLNNQKWKLAAATVAETDFIIVGLVPWDDLTANSTELRARTATYTTVVIIIIIFLLLLATILAFYWSRRFALKVLDPVLELSRLLGAIEKSDLHFEMKDLGASSREINLIHKHFRNLMIAVRFGNEAYFAGDLQRALGSYLAAEQMMIEFNNERGRGICRNNIGGVYTQLGRYLEAKQAFEYAVGNAIQLLSEEHVDSRRSQWDLVIGMRQTNLGLALSALSDYDAAKSTFDDASSLFGKHDYSVGLAQVYGNLAHMYIEQGKVDEAEKLINDAYDIVSKTKEPIALQYAMMNKGIMHAVRNEKKEAIAWFMYVLQHFDITVAFVQKVCAQQIINLCLDESVGRPDIAKIVFTAGKKLLPDLGFPNQPRDIALILDVSGSMTGDYIRACRASLSRLITHIVKLHDSVRLEKFSDETHTVFDWSNGDPLNKTMMLQKIERETDCWGYTAFWDALKTTIESVNDLEDDVFRDRWVIALTDGEDNASKSNCEKVITMLTSDNKYNVGLIIITVGRLRNEAELRAVCDAVGKRSRFIPAEKSVEAIENAFSVAFRSLTKNVQLEWMKIESKTSRE
ncbi:hypothetical protein HK098_004865 [Nowakowskiella sp. JEL0407]|nr:hypothetical protein HK098_004865 [Nowakowskiella sp. JEL0407]